MWARLPVAQVQPLGAVQRGTTQAAAPTMASRAWPAAAASSPSSDCSWMNGRPSTFPYSGLAVSHVARPSAMCCRLLSALLFAEGSAG